MEKEVFIVVTIDAETFYAVKKDIIDNFYNNPLSILSCRLLHSKYIHNGIIYPHEFKGVCIYLQNKFPFLKISVINHKDIFSKNATYTIIFKVYDDEKLCEDIKKSMKTIGYKSSFVKNIYNNVVSIICDSEIKNYK